MQRMRLEDLIFFHQPSTEDIFIGKLRILWCLMTWAQESYLRLTYMIGPFVWTELMKIERKACDEEYQCRLWFSSAELIHEYQTDSLSKQPMSLSIK